MGTFDTRHGAPLSPDIPDPVIFPIEDAVLEILEGAKIATKINDRVITVIHAAFAEAERRAQENERDAERYRYWRLHPFITSHTLTHLDQVDAFIDAARQGEEGKG